MSQVADKQFQIGSATSFTKIFAVKLVLRV